MALGDWTQVAIDPAKVVISLEIATPIVGNGSLKFVNIGTSNGSANMYLTDLPKGFTKGRIRTLLKWQVRPPHAAYERAGIIFMQSQLSAATISGNYYSFGLGAGPGATGAPGTLYWTLDKKVGGTLALIGTILNDDSSETVVNGDYWPMQVDWVVDIPNLGGTRITCSRGTKNSTDFSTLAVIIDHLDTSSPLTTSVGEGLFDSHPSSGFTTHEAVFDETTIYELT